MESIQIYLNSKYADKYGDGGISDCEYIIPETIEIPDGFHIYLSVVSCLIPFSFYNINDNNNKLIYSINGGMTYNITIPIGNYNINDLVKYLKSVMTNFNVTYNNLQNKLTFQHVTNDFMFMSSSTCLSVIGFNNNSTTISTNKILTSSYCVDLYIIKNIQVNSNLITYNINKLQKNNYCILCSIPVSNQPFSLIEYINRTNFKTNLFVNKIRRIHIKLTDENGNILNLNVCNYVMTIQLDVVDFIK